MARTIKKITADPTTTSRWRRIAIIGLIVFVVVDIVLVTWAIAASRVPRETSGAPGDTTTPVARVTASPTPIRPTTTATSTPISVADAVAPTRLLAVLDGNTAWRAKTGPCPATPAATELSTDGGATWKQSDASGPTGASSIIRLTVQSARQASGVALTTQGCTPEFIRTYVAGDNWATYADQLGSAWYADPKTPGTVHTPTGDKPAPCATVVGLAVGSGTGDAAVLCAAHDVHTTTDGGATWGAARTVPGAVAVTAADSGYLVAAVGASGCAGTSIVALGGDGAPATRACVGTTAPAAGDVAIGAGSGAVWLWAGDATTRSTDGGTTWR